MIDIVSLSRFFALTLILIGFGIFNKNKNDENRKIDNDMFFIFSDRKSVVCSK